METPGQDMSFPQNFFDWRGRAAVVVSFSNQPRPTMRVFRDDLDTGEAVAVQIVDYLARAIHEMPELCELAEPAGIPHELIEQKLREVPRVERERAAVRTLVRVANPT